MSKEMENVVEPGPLRNTVRTQGGKVLKMPEDWALLPPGDATFTRRVKAGGAHYVVQVKKGRRVLARGVWAPNAVIESVRAELEAERSTAAYAKRKAADANRREKVQAAYVEDFAAAVKSYLRFHSSHEALADRMAKAVAEHATPIGSGTVARTKRIPIRRRAEAAVLAWMRHRTTDYDTIKVPRVKGKRREIRQILAQRSKALLALYRSGEEVGEVCLITAALASAPSTADQPPSGASPAKTRAKVSPSRRGSGAQSPPEPASPASPDPPSDLSAAAREKKRQPDM